MGGRSHVWQKLRMTFRSVLASFVLLSASTFGAELTLLGELNCTACHAASAQQAAWLSPKVAPTLQDVGSRASAAWLVKYLASPNDAKQGATMPDMLHGNAEQAEALTHYLLSLSKPNVRRVLPDRAAVARGEDLFHSVGCVACHAPQNGAVLTAVSVALPRMAEKWGHDGLRKFLLDPLTQLNAKAPAAPSPAQRVAHTMATFRCTACHVRDGMGGVSAERNAFFTANVDDLGDEGRIPPKLDGVGDKLRPEWLAKVLGEGVSVRPYVNTRMPKFGAANVGHLAELFVALDRHATPLAAVADTPDAQRDAGRRLAGTDGLSCIACHRFNRQPAHAMQVFDLTTSTERLNEDWFRRFLRDPNKFNTGTRMPALWPGGRSLIAAVLDGDTDRQHAALWTYLGDGANAKFPEGLSRQNMELIVGGDASVARSLFQTRQQ